MKYEVACLDGTLYLKFNGPEVIKKLMGCVEDMAKSEIFNSNYEEARDLLDFYLDLEEASRKMIKEVDE